MSKPKPGAADRFGTEGKETVRMAAKGRPYNGSSIRNP